MASLEDQAHGLPANPLDTLEDLVSANEGRFNRYSDSELMLEVLGRWCGYQMYVVWDEQLSAMFVSCQLDLRVPEPKRAAIYELLASVNENIWLGHFDFLFEGGVTMYRSAVPMRGASGLSAEQLEDMVDAATDECERFFPALQMVVWGGQSVTEAITVARMETVGEA